MRTHTTSTHPFPQVSFPLVLDLLEFCTPELQAQLKGPRVAGASASLALPGASSSRCSSQHDASHPFLSDLLAFFLRAVQPRSWKTARWA
jgi:hypothetical protein